MTTTSKKDAAGTEVSREPTNTVTDEQKMMRAKALLKAAKKKFCELKQKPSDEIAQMDLTFVKLRVCNLETYIEHLAAGGTSNWQLDSLILGLPE